LEFTSNFIDDSRLFLTGYLNSIKQCLETLNDEDIWWRPNEESNSIGNLLLHISGSLRQWILTGIAGAADHRVRQQEFDDRSRISKDELFSKLNSTVQDVDKVIAQIDTSRLMEKMQLFGKEVTWMFAIYHMVEHFSMHAGQIIMITKFRTGKNLALQ
jgi:uncharacterized damage-inducible protein DinB